MKNVMFFHFESCPYCKQARAWLAELLQEEPEFQKLNIERIDEKLNPEEADKYDYYYVPTFYVDGMKVHEGAATKQKIRQVLESAM